MTGLPNISGDLSELIGLFQSHHVEFMVVGAHALSLFGHARFTEDIDLFVNRTTANATRVRKALEEFGIGISDQAEEELAQNARGMIVLGNKPNQIDILNFLDGVEFEVAQERTTRNWLAGYSVPFISLIDFIATKKASGRTKDFEDLNRLRERLGQDFPADQ